MDFNPTTALMVKEISLPFPGSRPDVAGVQAELAGNGVPATAQAPCFPSQHVPQLDLREGVPGS